MVLDQQRTSAARAHDLTEYWAASRKVSEDLCHAEAPGTPAFDPASPQDGCPESGPSEGQRWVGSGLWVAATDSGR